MNSLMIWPFPFYVSMFLSFYGIKEINLPMNCLKLVEMSFFFHWIFLNPQKWPFSCSFCCDHSFIQYWKSIGVLEPNEQAILINFYDSITYPKPFWNMTIDLCKQLGSGIVCDTSNPYQSVIELYFLFTLVC